MTKTATITMRIPPALKAAVADAAAAEQRTVSEYVSGVLATHLAVTTTPIEQQAWYRAGELVAKARDYVHAAAKSKINRDASIISAIMHLADAIDILNGTDDPAGGQ